MDIVAVVLIIIIGVLVYFLLRLKVRVNDLEDRILDVEARDRAKMSHVKSQYGIIHKNPPVDSFAKTLGAGGSEARGARTSRITKRTTDDS